MLIRLFARLLFGLLSDAGEGTPNYTRNKYKNRRPMKKAKPQNVGAIKTGAEAPAAPKRLAVPVGRRKR